MQIGDKVLDTKYNKIVIVDYTILEAREKLKERWLPVDRRGEVIEEAIIVEETKEETVETTKDSSVVDVDAVRAEYLEAKGEEVPVNKKNDIEWMKTKIAETK